jgi:nucleoside-diphosphate-sugar epimerase
MAVVVTGAAGFIGSRLAHRLSAGGADVIGIDRLPAVPEGVRPFRHLVADLGAPSPEAVEALSRADRVWHLAARPGVRDTAADIERRRFLDNVCVTHIVCDLVPDDVPLVFTSSSSVYGGALHGGIVAASAETDELRPAGGYARSKMRAERAVLRRMRRGGKACIARPFTVIGSPQRPDMALARWTRAALNGSPLRVFGSLQRARDFTDLDGAVEALVRLSEVGMGHTVNVGTGFSHTLEELVRIILDVSDSNSDVLITDASDVEVPVTLADTTLLESLTGMRPVTDLRAVAERQAELSQAEKTEVPV